MENCQGVYPHGLEPAAVCRASTDALCKQALQALAADPQEEGLQEVLRNVFGFPSFRGHQLPVVQAVLQGRSTLAIMPTGARDKPPLSAAAAACKPLTWLQPSQSLA